MAHDEVLRLRPAGLEWREVDGEILMLDLESSQYLAVNAVGAVLWPSLVEGASGPALVQVLQDRYPQVPVEDLRRDVGAFLDSLSARGLLAA